MNILYIEFRLANGEIVGFGNTFRENLPPDIAIAVDIIADGQSAAIDVSKEKIDPVSRTKVSKTPAEREGAVFPDITEIMQKVASELNATDQFMMLDRPMLDDQRSNWAGYRQSLRDISKVDPARNRVRTITEMVQEWPSRPDGSDPISNLRSRI